MGNQRMRERRNKPKNRIGRKPVSLKQLKERGDSNRLGISRHQRDRLDYSHNVVKNEMAEEDRQYLQDYLAKRKKWSQFMVTGKKRPSLRLGTHKEMNARLEGVAKGLGFPDAVLITGQTDGLYPGLKDFWPIALRTNSDSSEHPDYNTHETWTQHAVYTLYTVIEAESPIAFHLDFVSPKNPKDDHKMIRNGYMNDGRKNYSLETGDALVFPSRTKHSVSQNGKRTVIACHFVTGSFKK